ncbi:hypothetical protein Ahy_A03g016597 isoform D [Arachis hypogaea]|uniref:Uncharacterized protein n=1 Tax=Arachis hypogaea TaxID=3818 RepID=A0A445E3Z8_ARAHY|nr:hypothetical protein Ahy_A03g016597 isoform D [Arachis hypogaea]
MLLCFHLHQKNPNFSHPQTRERVSPSVTLAGFSSFVSRPSSSSHSSLVRGILVSGGSPSLVVFCNNAMEDIDANQNEGNVGQTPNLSDEDINADFEITPWT